MSNQQQKRNKQPVIEGVEEIYFKDLVTRTIQKQIGLAAILIISGAALTFGRLELYQFIPLSAMIVIDIVFGLLAIFFISRTTQEREALMSNRPKAQMTELDVDYHDMHELSIFPAHRYIVRELKAREQI